MDAMLRWRVRGLALRLPAQRRQDGAGQRGAGR
jgi:hypothetical protein